MKKILNISFPAILELTLYNFLSVFDMMLIGKCGGSSQVSEIGICNNIFNTFLNIFIFTGICIGITTLASQSYGAIRYKDANEYAETGFFIGIIISILIGIFIYINTDKILIIAGIKRANLIHTAKIMRVLCISIVFNMNINVINSILRSYGNMIEPFKISIYVSISKIILDFLIIFGLKGYVSAAYGAAIASVLAQLIGFLFDYYYVVKVSTDIRINLLLKINLKKIVELLKLSIPSSCEEAAYSLSRLICTFIIMRAGTVAFAANEIANSIESVSFMPGTGFGMVATTLVGISYGRKDFKGLKRSANECFYYSLILMMSLAIVFVFGSEFLVKFFINEKLTMKYAAICLSIGAFEQPTIALSMVFSNALKGMGDTKTPFIVTTISSCLIRLPLTFICIHILNKPIYYVWWITVIEWCVDGIMMWACFNLKVKKLKQHKEY